MATIRQVATNVMSLDLLKESMKTVVDMTKEIIELNIDQMKHGKKSDGSMIGKYKDPFYAQMKHDMNPLAGYGNKDFILTGAHSESMFIQPRQASWDMGSLDWKSAILVQSAGQDIYGLSKESKAKLVNTGFEKQLLERVHSVTKL